MKADIILTAGIKKNLRPENIGLEENLRCFNRAVNVRFRSKIHNCIKAFLLKKGVNRLSVCDISFEKAKVRPFKSGFKRFKVAGIRQSVKADYPPVVMLFKLIIDKV